jgi:hypothetical protein
LLQWEHPQRFLVEDFAVSGCGGGDDHADARDRVLPGEAGGRGGGDGGVEVVPVVGETALTSAAVFRAAVCGQSWRRVGIMADG